MKIDTITLLEIISKLPDPNTYHYDRYIAVNLDGVESPQEISFERFNFTDGSKRWVLELKQ